VDEALQTLVRLMPGFSTQDWSAPEVTLAMVTMPVVCLGMYTGGGVPSAVCVYAILYQLLIGGACFVFARRCLARPDEPEKPRREKPVTGIEGLAARRRRFPYYLIDPLREHPPIADELNPVMIKELRWGLLGRMTAMVRVFYIAFMVDMLLVSGAAVTARDSVSTVHLGGLLAIAAACLFAPLMLANIFTKEYEQENMDMLRMTLVTPGRVLLGKLAGGVAAFLPLVLPALLVLLLAVVLYAESYPAVVWVVFAVTFLVVAWCALALSLVASLHTRRAGAAFVLSYVLCLAFLLGVYPLAAGAAAQIWPWDVAPTYSGPAQPYHVAQQAAQAFSPLVAYGYLISYSYYYTRMNNFFVWMWSMGGFTIFGAAVLGYAHRVFRRRYLPG
jgi:ABC-type transport system involved in multi-copper enzyme maturation permease subunit